jgi:hypothetical protein
MYLQHLFFLKANDIGSLWLPMAGAYMIRFHFEIISAASWLQAGALSIPSNPSGAEPPFYKRALSGLLRSLITRSPITLLKPTM